MNKFSDALRSQVGRKVLTGLTGLALIGFVIVHLLGNLVLLTQDKDAFNGYAQTLHGLGPLLYAAELGLLIIIIAHACIGISIFMKKSKARGSRYAVQASAGSTSHQTLSSRTMAISGTALLVFIVLHIMHFKFGSFEASDVNRDIMLNGKPAEDIYSRVAEAFTDIKVVGLYVFAMLMLGFHLRHGFWSAFQSLGIAFPRYSRSLYALGVFTAIILALGFLMIPIYLYVAQTCLS